jgi:hypothetical protein
VRSEFARVGANCRSRNRFRPPSSSPDGRPVYGVSGDFNFFTPSSRRDGAFARATGDCAHSICISTRASISLNPLAAFKPLRISSVRVLSSSARLPRPLGGQGISLRVRSCRICIRELSNSRPADSVTLINSRAASKGSRTTRRGLHELKSGFTGAKSALHRTNSTAVHSAEMHSADKRALNKRARVPIYTRFSF